MGRLRPVNGDTELLCVAYTLTRTFALRLHRLPCAQGVGTGAQWNTPPLPIRQAEAGSIGGPQLPAARSCREGESVMNIRNGVGGAGRPPLDVLGADRRQRHGGGRDRLWDRHRVLWPARRGAGSRRGLLPPRNRSCASGSPLPCSRPTRPHRQIRSQLHPQIGRQVNLRINRQVHLRINRPCRRRPHRPHRRRQSRLGIRRRPRACPRPF